MNYEILNDNGEVINRIVADYDFVNQAYPGRFREAASQPSTQQYESAMEAHFDSVAQSKRYDNRVTCAMRASYEGPYQAEGAAFGRWMDACYAAGYGVLEKVQLGLLPFPSLDELLAGFPQMEWPPTEGGSQ